MFASTVVKLGPPARQTMRGRLLRVLTPPLHGQLWMRFLGYHREDMRTCRPLACRLTQHHGDLRSKRHVKRSRKYKLTGRASASSRKPGRCVPVPEQSSRLTERESASSRKLVRRDPVPAQSPKTEQGCKVDRMRNRKLKETKGRHHTGRRFMLAACMSGRNVTLVKRKLGSSSCQILLAWKVPLHRTPRK